MTNPFDRVELPDLEAFEKMMAELDTGTPSEKRLREMLEAADKVISTSNPTGALGDVVTTVKARVLALLEILGV